MKLMMTIITTASLVSLLINLKNGIVDIHCQWIRSNFQHQKNVLKRVHRYDFLPDKYLHSCLNHRGQASLLFLFISILAFSLTWIALAQVLDIRTTILNREKIMACTAWIESQSIKFNQQMDNTNAVIKKLRLVELGSKLTPAASKVLTAQLAILQMNQQVLVLEFLNNYSKPFTECKIYQYTNLILFQHQNFILKRDPLWKTAVEKISDKCFLNLSKNFMTLVLQKNIKQYYANRYLKEG